MGVGGSGEFQVGQCGQHETVRGVGCADDFVDAYRRRAEGFAAGARGFALLGVDLALCCLDPGGAVFGLAARSAREGQAARCVAPSLPVGFNLVLGLREVRRLDFSFAAGLPCGRWQVFAHGCCGP